MRKFKILCVILLTTFLVSVFFDLISNMIAGYTSESLHLR